MLNYKYLIFKKPVEPADLSPFSICQIRKAAFIYQSRYVQFLLNYWDDFETS